MFVRIVFRCFLFIVHDLFKASRRAKTLQVDKRRVKLCIFEKKAVYPRLTLCPFWAIAKINNYSLLRALFLRPVTFTEYLRSEKVTLHRTIPRNPEQNEVAEGSISYPDRNDKIYAD